MKTCEKCSELPKTGYIYMLDRKYVNKIKKVGSRKNLIGENASHITKTYYACRKHELEVKEEMLGSLPNLIHNTEDEIFGNENILSFDIINTFLKPKAKGWRVFI